MNVTITEEAWQKVVIDYARLNGWRVAHFRAARTAAGGWRTPVEADGEGFPDLVLVRGPELIFAELKSSTGKARPAQVGWLEALSAIGDAADRAWRASAEPGAVDLRVDVVLWRPEDWPVVEERLRRAA